jgi:hypothetical protein
VSSRPTILVADPDVRGRLWIVDVLRVDFAVSIPGPGEDPLRAARRLRPEAVLLAVPRGRSTEALRTCRAIKTDSESPPLVGILDQWGRTGRPERTLSDALADGYLGGRVLPDEVIAFARDVLAARRPVVSNTPPPGFMRRLLKTFR